MKTHTHKHTDTHIHENKIVNSELSENTKDIKIISFTIKSLTMSQ